ncbi:hypothetical protein AB0F92_38800 [Kitasatospora aureofaciens]|uniref:pPIWI_RE_Z domain-containing protein n=1 Tax=Kitasatospora aureofaciens TaxID=1894 RepID=UPI0033E73112
MRDERSAYAQVVAALGPEWAGAGAPDGFTPLDLCRVELGLRLLERLSPDTPAENAYALFSGYPFATRAGFADRPWQRTALAAARFLLWPLRRRAWRQALEAYRLLPDRLRAYALPPLDSAQPPRPQLPMVAADRVRVYDRALAAVPGLITRDLADAPAGTSAFQERRRIASVTIPEELVKPAGPGHDLAAGRPGGGEPLTVPRAELYATARWMDEREREAELESPGHWVRRLDGLRFAVRDRTGTDFAETEALTLDGLIQLVGMVGAGKSTFMSLVAVWAARRETPLRTTLVVGDVAEQLRLCAQFEVLGIPVAPVLGITTRELHVQRLHRRLASRGFHSILDQEDPGFDLLSTVCLVSGLRGTEGGPLEYRDAPCNRLHPESAARRRSEPATAAPLQAWSPEGPAPQPPPQQSAPEKLPGQPHACPMWGGCPRHTAARRQVDALVWVANPQSLVQSQVAVQLNDERLRQLELACLRSDLIFVDEADNVQMSLDRLFVPSGTLVRPDTDSWLDQVNRYKIEELSRRGRLPLTDGQVAEWNRALGGVTLSVDPLCTLLIKDEELRTWAEPSYFSPWTLQQKLLDGLFRDLGRFHREADREAGADGAVVPGDEEYDTAGPDDETQLYEGYDDVEQTSAPAPHLTLSPARRELESAWDEFRDDPFGEGDGVDQLAASLVRSARALLHHLAAGRTRTRMRRLADVLVSRVEEEVLRQRTEEGLPASAVRAQALPPAWWDALVLRISFLLLLSILHHRLERLTFLWPQVEAALRLDSQGRELARRVPLDYAPLVPEAPMGNVLGYQYLPDGEERDDAGRRGGTLRFFRCAGVGRELLLSLHTIGADPGTGRGGPHVVLMSGTSWAGESTRAHIRVPVSVVLKPSDEALAAVAGTSFATRFLYDREGRAMSLSGTPPRSRIAQAAAMAHRLGEPGPGGSSVLAQEISRIPELSRRRALLLVGSYREAHAVADTLNQLDAWRGKVRVLVPDDEERDPDAVGTAPGLDEEQLVAVRRGDVARFAEDADAEVLVAPLLAVERGHNILNEQGEAAFGVALFMVRPHPRPDDLDLSVFAVNDWLSRMLRDQPRPDGLEGPHTLTELWEKAGSLDEAARTLRFHGRREWRRLLTRRYAYRALPTWEKRAFAWDQLVTLWQVIGRLVRGGVPARVVFVDAAFAPALARRLAPGPVELGRFATGPSSAVTAPDGLLQALGSVLGPYLSASPGAVSDSDPAAPALVRLLYKPFYDALRTMTHR